MEIVIYSRGYGVARCLVRLVGRSCPPVTNGPVLVTGASGLLGTWLLRTAPAAHQVVALVHRTHVSGWPTVSADIRDAEAVRLAFGHIRPSLVVHAAYDRVEAPIVAGTAHVASAAQAIGADLLHVSSDAVLSGDGEPCDEDAVPDPVWDYGRWKARAESVVSSVTSSAIVRLPLIVSLEPEDHVVKHIRSGAASGERTTWFDDEVRQPALAKELAEAIWSIAALEGTERAGFWHLPGPESLSRYETAERVVATLGLDAQSIVAGSSPVADGRPRNINMRASRARRMIGWAPSNVLS